MFNIWFCMFHLQILQLWPSIRKWQWKVVLNIVLVYRTVFYIWQYSHNLNSQWNNELKVFVCPSKKPQGHLNWMWKYEPDSAMFYCFISNLFVVLFFPHFKSINHQMAGFSLYCLRNCFLVFPLLVHFCKYLHIEGHSNYLCVCVYKIYGSNCHV